MTESLEQLAVRTWGEMYPYINTHSNHEVAIEFARRLDAERGQTEFASRQEAKRISLGEDDVPSAQPASPANLEPVAVYAGVDMSRYTIEWINTPPLNKDNLHTIYDKDDPWPHVPVGTKLYAIPPGWTLVPLDPTKDMVDVASRWFFAYQHQRTQDKRNSIIEAYKAMLNAVRKA